MALTLNALKTMLADEATPAFNNGVNVAICPFRYDGNMINLEINLFDEGQYLQCKLPFFLSLADARNPEKALSKLLELNAHYRALKFGLTAGHDDVSVCLEIFLQDGELTRSQLRCCLYLLMTVAMEERGRLRTLLRTGIYPGSEDPAFTENLDRLMADRETY